MFIRSSFGDFLGWENLEIVWQSCSKAKLTKAQGVTICDNHVAFVLFTDLNLSPFSQCDKSLSNDCPMCQMGEANTKNNTPQKIKH